MHSDVVVSCQSRPFQERHIVCISWRNHCVCFPTIVVIPEALNEVHRPWKGWLVVLRRSEFECRQAYADVFQTATSRSTRLKKLPQRFVRPMCCCLESSGEHFRTMLSMGNQSDFPCATHRVCPQNVDTRVFFAAKTFDRVLTLSVLSRQHICFVCFCPFVTLQLFQVQSEGLGRVRRV